ncbi:hypothetical protein VTK73DRAFT_2243 [Phialemonium thermophilum]|uniref:Uncharacterized protein n=1 Tax=Phialemonium thermophilum TaxID=223376 RepID=A0ABR3VSF8_9PEZI
MSVRPLGEREAGRDGGSSHSHHVTAGLVFPTKPTSTAGKASGSRSWTGQNQFRCRRRDEWADVRTNTPVAMRPDTCPTERSITKSSQDVRSRLFWDWTRVRSVQKDVFSSGSELLCARLRSSHRDGHGSSVLRAAERTPAEPHERTESETPLLPFHSVPLHAIIV